MRDIINQVYRDRYGMDVGSSEIFLSQMFHRNIDAPRKIIVSRRGKDSPDFVFRIPQSKEGVYEESRRINYVRGLDKDIREHIPWTRYYDYLFPVEAQEWVGGSRLLDKQDEANIERAAKCLALIQRKTMKLDGDRFRSNLEKTGLGVEGGIKDRIINNALDKLSPTLCFCHGDYTPANIVLSEEIRLIDWEDSCYDTHYLFDVTHFVVFRKILNTKKIAGDGRGYQCLLNEIRELLLDDIFIKKYGVYGIKTDLDSIHEYLPFYFAERLEKYRSNEKKGVWKDRYLRMYRNLLKHSIKDLI